jgi:hypothetical protein
VHVEGCRAQQRVARKQCRQLGSGQARPATAAAQQHCSRVRGASVRLGRRSRDLCKGGGERLLRRERRAQLCQVGGCAGGAGGRPQHRRCGRSREAQPARLVAGCLLSRWQQPCDTRRLAPLGTRMEDPSGPAAACSALAQQPARGEATLGGPMLDSRMVAGGPGQWNPPARPAAAARAGLQPQPPGLPRCGTVASTAPHAPPLPPPG